MTKEQVAWVTFFMQALIGTAAQADTAYTVQRAEKIADGALAKLKERQIPLDNFGA